MTEFEFQFAARLKSNEYSKESNLYLKQLVVLVLKYKKFYDNFLEQNQSKIQDYFRKDNELLNQEQKNQLSKLLAFLESAKKLVVRSNKDQELKHEINEKEFKKYVPFPTAKKYQEWLDFVNYAEKNLQLTDISRLNYRLQFIVEFSKNRNFRRMYYYQAINQIGEKDDTDGNIFNKVHDDRLFAPVLDENVYLK